MAYVGQSYPRKDGYDKATGRGLFTHDIFLPKMLYAKVLRSPYAHAKVISLDTSAAEAMPGVRAVASFKNTTNKLFNTSATMVTTNPGMEPVRDQTVFTDEPKYIGDEICAVAADTEEIAEAAVKAIRVEYEELPYVLDPMEAFDESSPEVQPGSTAHHNVCGEIIKINFGEIEKGLAEADYVIEDEVILPRVKQAQMETHAAVATYKGDGTLEVISTTQTPHPTKMIIAYTFDLPESKVHVKNPPYVGGGFGVRIGISGKAEMITSALTMLCMRPVKYVYTREEDFIASDSRHPGYLKGRLGFNKDGRFVALDTSAWLNTGAYATFGVELLGVCGACGTAGTYHIPNLQYRGYPMYTNQETAGAFRGFGTPQGTAIVETLVDRAAKMLGMDPVELRKMNTMREEDDNWFPFSLGSIGVNECLDRAADAIGWKEKRGGEKKGVLRRGVGIACGTHVSNAAPFCVDYNVVIMRIEQDGSMLVNSGIPEIGPGSTTALLQVAADVMDLDLDLVTMQFGDSKAGPFDIGSHATRTLYTVSQVIEKAGRELRADIFNYAKDFIDASPDEMTIEKGVIKGNGHEITLKKLAYEAHLRGKQFIATANMVPPNSLPWYAQAAEVEVDMETGMVKVLNVAAAHDVGKAVNPRLAEGQIEGGVLQGVGYAVREEMTYVDGPGKGFYNEGFHKYMLPTADDRPEIEAILVESNDPKGVYGIKGIGEVGVCPTLPAVASAVEDATGIRFHEFPMTPGRVLAEIRKVYGEDYSF